MAAKTRITLPLLAALLVVLGVALMTWHLLRTDPPPVQDPPPVPDPALSDLATHPDWSLLETSGHTMPREEFEFLLRNVYTVGDRWMEFITLDDSAARIRTSFRDPERFIRIPFATPDTRRTPPRTWRPASALPPAPAGRPLDGLRVAIDPGHIGGEFARLEGRWFQIGTQLPVMEGEMTLQTSRHLQALLEALGAKVFLVRTENRPVTAATPDDFIAYAARRNPGATPAAQQAFATRLFYRNSEIRARARLINETIKPDLVLCLHFNAENWGPDPSAPRLSDRNHFHLILNGAYTAGEIPHDDERFALVSRILQGTHAEELALAKVVATTVAAETGLPPYAYKANSSRALPLDNDSYIWARNLLANRCYECPVIFFEPYVMNSKEVHARVQAGDYEGMKTVAGKARRSIYREYAMAVARGLEIYYTSSRSE